MSVVLTQARKRINNLFRGQKGISLVETLVALAILGFIGVSFLQALATTSMGADAYEERVTAQFLAQWQVEDITTSPYLEIGDYDEVSPLPANYTISISTVQQDVGKQEVTVQVFHHGEFVLEMTDLKVDW